MGWRGAPLIAVLLVSAGTARAELRTSETEHYTLTTDLGRREARRVERFLEAMHATYREVFPHEPVRDAGRATVRVLAARADYDAYGRDDADVAFNANWRGYFARDRNELVSYRGEDMRELLSILSHEGFHQFAWAHMTPEDSAVLPPWFEEGLAEYFRSHDTRRGELRHSRQPHHVARVGRAIREGWVWTLDELWGCDPGAIEDALVFEAFYAHAHQFVSYLIDRERAAVLRIYRLKREGRTNEEIMAEVFGEADRGRLHRAFVAWVQR